LRLFLTLITDLWWLATRCTALTGLLLSIRRTGGAGFCDATIQQSLNQRATLLNGVATENLALHRLRRTAAMQTDNRIPTAGRRRRNIAKETGDLRTLVVGDIGSARE
jgi:hypothetical protein